MSTRSPRSSTRAPSRNPTPTPSRPLGSERIGPRSLGAMRTFFALAFVVLPAAAFVGACKKDEPPPPPVTSDDDDTEKKPKKKNKSSGDEDLTPITAGSDNGSTGTPVVGYPTGSNTNKGNSDDKAKLMACCTALHNAAVAAHAAENAANAAKAAGLPPPPPPPPPEEVEKQAKACDQAVVEFTGDLNKSLKSIKGASAIALPTACAIASSASGGGK